MPRHGCPTVSDCCSDGSPSGSDPTNGNADIFIAAADGTAQRQLTDHPASDVTPRSSPDGTSVVFTSERDGNPEIYVLVLATGHSAV